MHNQTHHHLRTDSMYCYWAQRMTRHCCRCVIVMRLCKRLRRTTLYHIYNTHQTHKPQPALRNVCTMMLFFSSSYFLFGRLKMMLHAGTVAGTTGTDTDTRTHAVRLLVRCKGSTYSADNGDGGGDDADVTRQRTHFACASALISPPPSPPLLRWAGAHTHDAHQAHGEMLSPMRAGVRAGSWTCPPHAANSYIMWTSAPAYRIITVISYIICWARICVDIDIDWFFGAACRAHHTCTCVHLSVRTRTIKGVYGTAAGCIQICCRVFWPNPRAHVFPCTRLVTSRLLHANR